ncbi:hypothetical protein HXW87_21865 [Pseudomonas sp. Y5-11]|jgi:hypothetical protein|uniref:hypothetical protein n=1 Tax=Pseudomonas TaxID=286 RepID=UPI000596D158|nr:MULTISPECIES: hypothetical protein [unclassified Pseudomonas]KIK83012.1 prophage PssSM-01 [Pseudomonas sp. W15Feb9B]ULN84710.1 hypothetical protein HXW87_21865 [Pseudomonas sp. Y5-11]
MENTLNINAKLPPAQAEALLVNLREQYRLSLNDLWYADQYRFIPEGLRHGSILANCPVMAAQKHLIGALSLCLKKVK